MVKREFIDVVAEKTGMSKKAAGESVNAVLETLTETLAKGETIQFPGFGTFYVADVPERTTRNPRTGGEVVVPAHKAPKFKFGKGVKDAVH